MSFRSMFCRVSSIALPNISADSRAWILCISLSSYLLPSMVSGVLKGRPNRNRSASEYFFNLYRLNEKVPLPGSGASSVVSVDFDRLVVYFVKMEAFLLGATVMGVLVS